MFFSYMVSLACVSGNPPVLMNISVLQILVIITGVLINLKKILSRLIHKSHLRTLGVKQTWNDLLYQTSVTNFQVYSEREYMEIDIIEHSFSFSLLLSDKARCALKALQEMCLNHTCIKPL